MIWILVCLLAVLEVTAVPFGFGAPWYMSQGAIVAGTTCAIIRNWPIKGEPKSGRGKRPKQPHTLRAPQQRRAA